MKTYILIDGKMIETLEASVEVNEFVEKLNSSKTISTETLLRVYRILNRVANDKSHPEMIKANVMLGILNRRINRSK